MVLAGLMDLLLLISTGLLVSQITGRAAMKIALKCLATATGMTR